MTVRKAQLFPPWPPVHHRLSHAEYSSRFFNVLVPHAVSRMRHVAGGEVQAAYECCMCGMPIPGNIHKLIISIGQTQPPSMNQVAHIPKQSAPKYLVMRRDQNCHSREPIQSWFVTTG